MMKKSVILEQHENPKYNPEAGYESLDRNEPEYVYRVVQATNTDIYKVGEKITPYDLGTLTSKKISYTIKSPSK